MYLFQAIWTYTGLGCLISLESDTLTETAAKVFIILSIENIYWWYFRITAVTTPPILSSVLGLMMGYLGLAASRNIWPLLFLKYFMVHSPSTSAITTSPLLGCLPFSTMTRSPSTIPSSIMESPLTFRRKDESGFVIRYSSMDIMSQSTSSSGDGKPAWTDPTRGMANELCLNFRWPLSSFSRISAQMSLLIQKLTTLLDLTPRRPTISAKEGIRRFSRMNVAIDFRTVWMVRFSFMIPVYRTIVLLSREKMTPDFFISSSTIR